MAPTPTVMTSRACGVVDEVVPGQHLVFEGGQGCLGGALFRVVELRPIALVDTEPLGAATAAVRAANTD